MRASLVSRLHFESSNARAATMAPQRDIAPPLRTILNGANIELWT